MAAAGAVHTSGASASAGAGAGIVHHSSTATTLPNGGKMPESVKKCLKETNSSWPANACEQMSASQALYSSKKLAALCKKGKMGALPAGKTCEQMMIAAIAANDKEAKKAKCGLMNIEASAKKFQCFVTAQEHGIANAPPPSNPGNDHSSGDSESDGDMTGDDMFSKSLDKDRAHHKTAWQVKLAAHRKEYLRLAADRSKKAAEYFAAYKLAAAHGKAAAEAKKLLEEARTVKESLHIPFKDATATVAKRFAAENLARTHLGAMKKALADESKAAAKA